jgi:hypothetical protein
MCIRDRLNIPKAEKDKIILMWSGVAFFMILIVGFWIFSFKQTIGSNTKTDDKSFDWSEINKMTDELSKNYSETKNQIAEMKQILEAQSKQIATTTEIATTSEINLNSLPQDSNNLNPEELEKIKQGIINLEKE